MTLFVHIVAATVLTGATVLGLVLCVVLVAECVEIVRSRSRE